MDWVRRVLRDTEDDGRYRSGLGAILGGCIAMLPLLFGMLDAETALIATLIGSVVAVVAVALWRPAGGALDGPMTIIAYVAFLVASVVVVRQLPVLAFFVFLGGFTFTLSVLRLVTGWRNPVPVAPASELELGPIQPGLVLALVLPLLALVIFIVIGVSVELGVFR
jgi:hypothetical protein